MEAQLQVHWTVIAGALYSTRSLKAQVKSVKLSFLSMYICVVTYKADGTHIRHY